MKSTAQNKAYDVVIIGAGPAGLCFAQCLSGRGLKIAVLEKQPLAKVAQPDYDGREIALTHLSHQILLETGIWAHIPKNQIALIKDAKVMDGTSPYALHFDHRDTGKDNLGFMVSNQSIRQAVYTSVAACKDVTIIPDTEVTAITSDQTISTITCQDGMVFTCALAVAADSRFSPTRRMMGIETDMLDFGRTCIVTTMDIEHPHNQTACEMFHYGQTLAVLPLVGKRVSVVITANSAKANDILSMPPDSFARDIESRIDTQFGRMTLSNQRYAYPLVATYASTFHARRYALMGDAAVGMHPVTAHGFNLGLSGAHTLATIVTKTLATGGDIGSSAGLAEYSRAHRTASRSIYLGTNTLVRLYTDETALGRTARAGLLRVAGLLPPIRQAIMNRLTEIRPLRAPSIHYKKSL